MPPRRAALVFSTLILVAGSALAAGLDAQMRDVERLRGVRFLHPVASRTITREQLPDLLRDQMQKSLPYSADDYALILRALQLVDGKTPDLVGKMLDLYQSQVLAFYDPLTHTYFALRDLPPAVSAMAGSDILQQSVVIHELTHALQDQRFGAADRDRALQKDTDGGLAYHAVLEGEATLVMLAWMADKAGQPMDTLINSETLLSEIAAAANADKSMDAAVPRYFVEELKFPYVDGLRFAIAAYRHGGGWKGLDAVHASQPRSTREILHPDEYFARVAKGGAESAFSPATEIPHGLTVEHLGEFHWRFLVGDAAAGWLDDRVVVAQDEHCDPTVLVDSTWESAARAKAFRDGYERFLRERGVAADSRLDGARVRVAYGVDAALAAGFLR
jgi:hypothetical protein